MIPPPALKPSTQYPYIWPVYTGVILDNSIIYGPYVQVTLLTPIYMAHIHGHVETMDVDNDKILQAIHDSTIADIFIEDKKVFINRRQLLRCTKGRF